MLNLSFPLVFSCIYTFFSFVDGWEHTHLFFFFRVLVSTGYLFFQWQSTFSATSTLCRVWNSVRCKRKKKIWTNLRRNGKVCVISNLYNFACQSPHHRHTCTHVHTHYRPHKQGLGISHSGPLTGLTFPSGRIHHLHCTPIDQSNKPFYMVY